MKYFVWHRIENMISCPLRICYRTHYLHCFKCSLHQNHRTLPSWSRSNDDLKWWQNIGKVWKMLATWILFLTACIFLTILHIICSFWRLNHNQVVSYSIIRVYLINNPRPIIDRVWIILMKIFFEVCPLWWFLWNWFLDYKYCIQESNQSQCSTCSKTT